MTRLLLRISIIILITIGSAFMLIDFILKQRFEHDFNKTPPTPVLVMAKLINEQFSELSTEQLPRETRRLAERMKASINLVHKDDPSFPKSLLGQIGDKPGDFWMHLKDHSIYLRLKDDYFLHFKRTGKRHSTSEFTIALVVLAMLLITFISASFLALPMVRRIEKLRLAAQRISRGELNARAEPSGPSDSIGDLARSFNHMAATNERLIESQRHLLEAVTHELRTPTARIRFGLELMLDASSEQEREKRLTDIDNDLTELDELVNELLLYHRFEDGKRTVDHQPVDVSEVMEGLVRRLAHLRQELKVELRIDESLPALSADARSFSRAMQNLLANAMKYASSRVIVEAKATSDQLVIDIMDDGPGIPENMREEIFLPFKRVDPSRSKSTGGVGLGLAIVKRIIDHHEAFIEIRDTPGGGANLHTRWPL